MRKIIQTSLTALLAIYFIFAFTIEPALLAAQSDADQVQVQLTVDSGIAITSTSSDATMSPNMGVSQNTSVGTTTWVVKTNALNGYSFSLQASSSPAMKHTSSSTVSFANFTEAVAGTPETWAVDSGSYQFGYSVLGTDTLSAYGTGTVCESALGAPSTTLNFRHASTTAVTAANRASPTTFSGSTTTACYAAGQNGIFAPSGNYNATITATAIINP